MENDNPIYIVTIVAYEKITNLQPFSSPRLAVNFLNSCINTQFETQDLTEYKIRDKLATTEFRGTDIFIRFINENAS